MGVTASDVVGAWCMVVQALVAKAGRCVWVMVHPKIHFSAGSWADWTCISLGTHCCELYCMDGQLLIFWALSPSLWKGDNSMPYLLGMSWG